MGLGDWIMATSQVKSMHEADGRQHPVLVVDRTLRPRWSDVFLHNPRITRRYVRGCLRLVNGPGLRPYIQGKTVERWLWKRWDIKPGELYLTGEEKDFGNPYRGCIVIEPNTKVPGGNKSWKWERWQQLANRLKDDFQLVQMGVPGHRALDNVRNIETTFREAMAVLAASRVFVGCEGGLHHAAAALSVPAVVLWSEFISPEFTGYAYQHNIRHASRYCGSRLPCSTCVQSMNAITVDEVYAALLRQEALCMVA